MMENSESYEQRVKFQRDENRKLLESLGVFQLSNGLRTVRKELHEKKQKKVPHGKRLKKELPSSSKSNVLAPSRRSNRLLGRVPQVSGEEVESEPNMFAEKTKAVKRENTFGAIPGVSVGTHFLTRLEASYAGIHRPTVAGIHGNPLLGCYSLALSGGYEDDIDSGDSFIYTGEGGRDLKGTKSNPKNLRTAPQSKDQVLERGNLALSKNIENKLPVRVLRGYKLNSEYAPPTGYRYDGLYMVDDFFVTKGLSGFQVYKFRLSRVKDQEPGSWQK